MMEGWKKIVLGAIGKKFYSGGTPSTKVPSYWNGDIEWITSKWLTDKLYLVNGEKFISLKGLQNSASKLVPKRSLIVATRVGVGKVCINQINIAINQDLFGIEINEEEYSLEFLAYQLRSETIQNYINSFKRGATIQGVTKDCIKSILINLPPLPEQRKIAYVLSTVQKAIEQQDKLIRTTTELKKALMQKLFTEGLYGEKQKETQIGLVPESWEVVELYEVCERISENINPDKNGTSPYVGLEHIDTGRIKLRNWGYENEVKSSKSKFSKGQILYGKLRPYLDKAVLTHIDGICSTDILVFNGINDVYNTFLIHFFHTEKFLNHAKSTTSGVQHPRTSWNNLKKLKLGLPAKKERVEISLFLNALENKIEHHEKKKQTLQDLFKTLLHELMTGQRRVNEIDFTGAETLEAPITNNKQKEHPLNKRKE